MEAGELAQKLLRFYPYIKNGGVTISGGEPLLQAEFVAEVVELLHKGNLQVAIDTCGVPFTPAVEHLLQVADLFLVDIKMTTEEDYKQYTSGSLAATMAFLDRLEEMKKDVWIRHVVVPGINDNEEDVLRFAELIKGYRCIKKIELLPFKNLCLGKYKAMNIPCPLAGTEPMRGEELARLEAMLEVAMKSC